MVAYNLRKVENRDRYPDPPSFLFGAGGETEKKHFRMSACTENTPCTRKNHLRVCLLKKRCTWSHLKQRIGAAEARWAHNPKVVRSKLTFATLFLLLLYLLCCVGHTLTLTLNPTPTPILTLTAHHSTTLGKCLTVVRQRIGAAEARWAHNPKVLRSKLRFATTITVPPSSVDRAQDS